MIGMKDSILWRTHHSKTVVTIRGRDGLHISWILNHDTVIEAIMRSLCRFNLYLADIAEIWLSSGSRTCSLVVILERSAGNIVITPRGGVRGFTPVWNKVIPRPLAQVGILGRFEISP